MKCPQGLLISSLFSVCLLPIVLDLLERVNVSVLPPSPVRPLVSLAELEPRVADVLDVFFAVVSLRMQEAIQTSKHNSVFNWHLDLAVIQDRKSTRLNSSHLA